MALCNDDCSRKQLLSDSNPYAAPAVAVNEGTAALPDQAAAVRPWTALALLAAAHFLVDVVASTTNPIGPTLERDLSLATGGLLWVYFCWSLATSFGQLFFALWADRRPCRWLIWTGPLLAILCLSCLGLAASSLSLLGLFVMGGLGIAAFHPEAAATAGALLPAQRSRAMAIFALCGYLGQSAGPYYSGTISDHLGLRGLVWGIGWGLPVLCVLWLGLRRTVPTGAISAHSSKRKPVEPAAKGIPPGVLTILLAVGALRILPALGVPLAIAYLLKEDVVGCGGRRRAIGVYGGHRNRGDGLRGVSQTSLGTDGAVGVSARGDAAAGDVGVCFDLDAGAAGRHLWLALRCDDAGLHQLRAATTATRPARGKFDHDGCQLGNRRRDCHSGRTRLVVGRRTATDFWPVRRRLARQQPTQPSAADAGGERQLSR